MTIQDVSQALKIPKHTLRFWEKVFEGILVPHRTDGGQRRYCTEHVFILEEVKRLKGKGMSLADIRTELAGFDAERCTERNRKNFDAIDDLADEIAETVKIAVRNFFRHPHRGPE